MHQDFNQLEVTGLTCILAEKTIFAGLTFGARSADVVHLKGQNGSGKTSLLRMLCGFAQPVAGRMTWNGSQYPGDTDTFRHKVAYIGHRRGVSEELTPLENLRFANELDSQRSETACQNALERVQLTHVAKTPTRYLSAGQNQRTALARLLVSNAPLWLLDEPFNALDPSGRSIAETLIAEHSGRGGISIIATHQLMSLGSIPTKTVDLDLC